MDSLSVLLQAAEYLDKKDREIEAAEHTYASSLPMPDEYSRRKSRNNRKSQGSRRAHLRHCMERLKSIVPVGPDASRHTTLSLLTKAKAYIKSLEDTRRGKEASRLRLNSRRDHLRNRLQQLISETNIGLQYRLRVERTISECSSNSTASSSSSLSMESTESEFGSLIRHVCQVWPMAVPSCYGLLLRINNLANYGNWSVTFSDLRTLCYVP
ncbi:hypothetical protein LSH36_80g01016 [Paralvinella palmiformis]|uniref:BHLH domain-containing protein n=1 Tax=Paralvinella palmiformis TaxID=53620 RepID=A0AAD9NDN8_9ANNE|nr:hypothetical protein LSH36_80g01016 [Paralvinella palmiformis]